MKLISLIHRAAVKTSITLLAAGLAACGNLYENLPQCRLYVKFKYDYNMLSADAFHTQVGKVQLFVFDKNGLFLFTQSEQGQPLASGHYLMPVDVAVGEYKFMAWAGAGDSYQIPELTPGESTIDQLTLKLKRDQSRVIDKELEPLWYGEIINVDFDGTRNQTETINLIKDTNKIRFVFQGYNSSWTINKDDYTYELVEANGFMSHTNELLNDDVITYTPYLAQQHNPSAIIIELNTLRLMADRPVRFVVTEIETGAAVFEVNLTDFFLMLRMAKHEIWSDQEYLDREDEFQVVFFMYSWLAMDIKINDWTWYSQDENGGL